MKSKLAPKMLLKNVMMVVTLIIEAYQNFLFIHIPLFIPLTIAVFGEDLLVAENPDRSLDLDRLRGKRSGKPGMPSSSLSQRRCPF